MDFEYTAEHVRVSGLFNAGWYTQRYPEVIRADRTALETFLDRGAALRHDPGPNFDTDFYLQRYVESAPGYQPGTEPVNALLEHLRLGSPANRPLNRRALCTRLAALDITTRLQWERAPTSGPRPAISYCIPLMGRLGDIQETLGANLEAHAALQGQVEFLIVLFGDSDEAWNWISSRFSGQLRSGLLRLVRDDTLDSWHFGKAKNAFRPHLRGRIYSSLDGDNFVTAEETRAVLAVDQEHDGLFLLHHFSGNWGDGSSGRISMPTAIYREIGYNPAFLPRQQDEVDLVLRALLRHPAMPFVCTDPDKCVLKLSKAAIRFRTDEGLVNRIVKAPAYERKAPLNPRGDNYTSAAPHMYLMGRFNAAIGGYAASPDPGRRQRYLADAYAVRQKLVEALPLDDLLDTVFRREGRPRAPRLDAGDVGVFLCVRDEEHFLEPLIRHYRALGVKAIFIVDDGSETPVETRFSADDIHVFHPKIGDFRTSKTLWIEALMRVHLADGAWALTVDADEFIPLPANIASFPALAGQLEAQGQDFATGLMLDLVPAPDTSAARLAHAERDFLELFTHCGNFSGPPDAAYAGHKSIAWGFGPYAGISWKVDLRWHAFGTFDSLRKIPFFRYRPTRHLNQGFHSLYEAGAQPGHEIWQRRPILAVHHYKLVRLYSQAARAQMLRLAANYHARTSENITRIFAGTEGIERLSRLAGSTTPVTRFADLLPRPGEAAAQAPREMAD